MSTEAQLQEAVRALQSHTTILIAPGRYALTSTLWINGSMTDVTLRGDGSSRDDVVIVGEGMRRPATAAMPLAIWVGGNVDGVTIAHLTIRDFYDRTILFTSGTQRPHVDDVHLIDSGGPFIDAVPGDSGLAVDNGIVESSLIEFSTTARTEATSGIEIRAGTAWIIRDNVFRNIVGPSYQPAGPAVVAWNGARDTVTERNQFINCSMAIAYGAIDADAPDHTGGIIRNNFVFRSASQSGSTGIVASNAPAVRILNNTLFLSGTYGTPIELRFPGTHDAAIVNNLLDGTIWTRDGASATEQSNLPGATADFFVDASTGNLHLSSRAASAIDRGATIEGVIDDIDRDLRPAGRGYDIGADELVTNRTAAAVKPLEISGRVTNAAGGQESGVTIMLSGARVDSTVTDNSGSYSFTNLASNADYTVTPAKISDSFAPSSLSFSQLTESQTADFVATTTAPSSGGGTGGGTVKGTVVITSPTNGATFTAPASITMTASASSSDPSRAITKVTYYLGSTALGSAGAAPYTFTWTGVAAGYYSLKAVATLDRGGNITSDLVSIKVAPPAASAPQPAPTASTTATVTSPTNGTSYTAPASFGASAAAASTGAVVTRIDLYSNQTLVASSTATSVSATLSNLAAGTYALTAVASDSLGGTTTSAAVNVTVSAPLTSASSGTDPTTWPLVQPTSLTRVGAFRLPNTSSNGAVFDFGGSPIAFNPAGNTLFVGTRTQQVAEVSIPTPSPSTTITDLPFASYVQGFADPVEGHITAAMTDPSNWPNLCGLQVFSGALYGTVCVYYDANNGQLVSHYKRSLSLSTPSFSGFSAIWAPTTTDVNNGVPSNGTSFAHGYMIPVPAAWQPLLGAPALSGQFGLPIIWRESYGPSVIAFDPAQVGVSVSGKALLYYTGAHPTLGPYENPASNPIWSGTAKSGGAVIIDGTRSLLVFGRNGLGPFCYGEGTSTQSLAGTPTPDGSNWCYDPADSSKGTHGYPYDYHVWAYDLNDLAAVKAGTKQPYQVVPYAQWSLGLPYPEPSWNGIGGVAYDPATKQLYLSQMLADTDGYASRALLHVFALQF